MRDINELIGKEFEFEGKGYKVFGAKFEEDMILLSTEIKEQNTKKKYALSEMSKAYFKNVHPYLVEVMTTAITDSPYDFRITAGARTAKEQNALYQIGRTRAGNKVTNADGYKNKSNHQICFETLREHRMNNNRDEEILLDCLLWLHFPFKKEWIKL